MLLLPLLLLPVPLLLVPLLLKRLLAGLQVSYCCSAGYRHIFNRVEAGVASGADVPQPFRTSCWKHCQPCVSAAAQWVAPQ
jgi:hypothetical protein